MMIRTILGRATCRCAVLAMAVGMAVGFGVVPAEAGMGGHIDVTIPFAFKAGRNAMPAGEYTVRVVGDGVLSLVAESGDRALVLARSESTGESGTGVPSLVFACYGTERFLSEVRSGWDGTRLHVAKTRSEERLAKAADSPGTVLVIAARGR